ncbi:UNVERIFIED_CONTAM: hypothetical protein PYX00_011270 [Menopon gallinae]|uniref:O-acyltransferase n=1 Tax=Menopon gallinae TaxID=328185 RepID=A0AAW2H752_9NEOP
MHFRARLVSPAAPHACALCSHVQKRVCNCRAHAWGKTRNPSRKRAPGAQKAGGAGEQGAMAGVQNLSYIVSVIFILRMVSENIRKHGFLMKLPLEDVSLEEVLYFLKTVASSLLRCAASFVLARRSRAAAGACLVAGELYVAYVNLVHIKHMYFSACSLTTSLYFLAKMVSFLAFHSRCSSAESTCTPGHFVYFMLAPTISFKTHYRTRRMLSRREFVLLAAKFAGSFLLLLFVIDQLSVPTIDRIQASRGAYEFAENFVILSVCTVMMFWLFFYMFFCCLLEMFAGLTMFGDGEFYGAWWNSQTVKEFWSTWNRLVHIWFRTHIFLPMVERGLSKKIASFTCFLVSGVLHEYVISFATKIFAGWTFLGFVAQVLLMETTDRIALRFPRCGNFVFWCIFSIIGQPACIWLHYRSLYFEKQRLLAGH